MTDCLFCKIIQGDIPGDIVYQDDDVLAFNDVNPQAPTHILIIPKKHIATTNDAQAEDAAVLGKLMLTASSNIAAATATLFNNCGASNNNRPSINIITPESSFNTMPSFCESFLDPSFIVKIETMANSGRI